MPDRGKGRPEPAKIEILVSIFLILIGFFVVLNANSEQDITRAGAVLESLNQAFDGRAIKAVRPFGPDHSEAGPFARELKKLSFALEQSSRTRPVYFEMPDGALYTIIELEGLFEPESFELTTASTAFLAALANASRSEAMAEILLLVGGPGSAAEGRAQGLQAELLRQDADFGRLSLGLLPDRRPGLFLFISESEAATAESGP